MAFVTTSPVVTIKPATLYARGLLTWRRSPEFRTCESIVLTLFFLISAYTLHYHEAWDDEAQAWLIARDNTVFQILRHRLHYEGAPPTWHLLLHFAHTLGLNYNGLGWLAISLATAGVYVWLRWSPFPVVPRLLLPFTFFLQYQYSVVARSYVLFPLLAFSLCVLYTRKQAAIWFAIVAGVLANISLQGFAMAMALVSIYTFEEYRAGAVDRSPRPTRRLGTAQR